MITCIVFNIHLSYFIHRCRMVRERYLYIFGSKFKILNRYLSLTILHLCINHFCNNKCRAFIFHICIFFCGRTFLCPRHKMARGHLVFALSVIPSFRPSVLPSFRPIKVCLLNSSYILAWICMKLGRDVVPQV